MAKNSKKTLFSILEFMALQREISQYQLPKLVGKSYRTILRNLRFLEKEGLVRLIRLEEAAKHGKERKIYRITLRGLLNALAHFPKLWEPETFDIIAENHADLLLTFKKWRFFKEKGLDTVIRNNFKEFFAEFAYFQMFALSFRLRVEWEDLSKCVDSSVLKFWLIPGSMRGKVSEEEKEQMRRILEACKEDPELSNFIDEQLNFFYEDELRYLRDIEEARKFWQQLKGAPESTGG